MLKEKRHGEAYSCDWRSGLYGSHLCKRLLEAGNEVLCVDNLFTGQRQNIVKLLPDPNFEFIRHDITLPLYVEVDQIYNLACPASPVHYQLDPVQTTKTNVHGTRNMLGLAKRTKARILQASTSEVYGDPEEHPQKESYWGKVNPIGIRSCYDEGKRCAETLFFDYHRQHNVDVRIIRIFNTYGPHMHPSDGRVVSNFIMQALQNENITIFGDGSQTRSFQYVDDLVAAIIRMMENNANFLGPVNIGNPEEFTIRELVEKVLALIPESTSKIIYKDLPQDDPKRRRPDISLAEEKLKWRPAIKLDQGLPLTIQYFRQLVANTKARGVLLICESSSLLKRVRKKLARLVDEDEVPRFCYTTMEGVKRSTAEDEELWQMAGRPLEVLG